MSVQQIADATPNWASWVTIVGSLALSILQPLAALAALVLAGLQIYNWFEKRRKKRS